MGKLYSIGEIAKVVGVTTETLKNWERMGYIPKSIRMGMKKQRMWSEWKVLQILEWTQSNGYPIQNNGILPSSKV